MSNTGRARLIAATLLTCLVPIATPAGAQQGWGPTTNLGPGLPSPPAAAVDHVGNIMAVWTASTGSGGVVRARRYSAAASVWSAPVDVSEAGSAGEPGIVVDAAGNAVASWTQGGIRAARYSVATDTWNAPVVVTADTGCSAQSTRAAIDSAGVVFFVWRELCRVPAPGSVFYSIIRAARYTPETGTVVESTLSGSLTGFVEADVVADASGNATVLWSADPTVGPNREAVMWAAYYTAATATWSAPVGILPAEYGSTGDGTRMGIDARGNITAVWRLTGSCNVVRAARYDSASRTWGQVTDLAAVSVSVTTQAEIAVDPAGNVLAVWGRLDGAITRVQAALWVAGSASWSEPVDVSPPGVRAALPKVATDGLGNMTAIWWQDADGIGSAIWTARRTSGGTVTVRELAAVAESTAVAAIGAGVGGHVAVVWRSGINTAGIVETAEWRATPAAPAITAIATGNGTLAVSVTPPVTPEPAFGAVYYDYSTDNGTTWTTRLQPSTVSPIRVGGLVNGVPYAVRVRAVNDAGPGAASVAGVGVPVPAPAEPRDLRVIAQSGRHVTLQWRPPVGGVPATGYVLEGGAIPGQVQASIPVGSGLPTFAFDAPPGTFYLRVHAVSGSGWSPPSNEIRIFVDVPVEPFVPLNFRSLVSGSRVTLSWTNNFAGGPPTGFLLSVRGGLNTSIQLPAGESFSVSGVPPGAYAVRLAAVNAAGASGLSNEVSFTVPSACSDPDQGPPHVPEDFETSTSGRAFYVAWAVPATGPAIERYDVQVSGTHTGTFTTTDRFLSGMAGPGAYTISVAGANACGVGTATAPLTIVIP